MMRPFCLFVSSLAFLFLGAICASREPVSGLPSRRINRVVALTSLSADLVMTLDPEVLVGIPATSLTKSDPRFDGITLCLPDVVNQVWRPLWHLILTWSSVLRASIQRF